MNDERQFMVNLSTSILDDFGFKAGMNVSELTKTKRTPNIWDYGNDKHAGFNVFSVKAPHPNPFFSEYGLLQIRMVLYKDMSVRRKGVLRLKPIFWVPHPASR